MKITQKTILTSLTLVTLSLLTNGCVAKNSDGSYTSAYSYHPYNSYSRGSSTSNQSDRSLGYNHNQNRFNSNLPASRVANNIETVAKSLLGKDYQYGANGPYQYDCSSFTKYVFSKQGINLPRVSRDQAKVGQFVRAAQLQKGDLIFFDSKKSSAVSHVGIYLGRGNFIHASSSKDQVTISNLNTNYYRSHFKWGRRVTNMSYASR